MPPARFWPQVLTAWGFAALVLMLTCGAAYLRMDYPDPDDILRLLEVRDLIGGQSWWDVDQHRLVSGHMHWSRVVDLPIAAIELPLRSFLSRPVAEHLALAIVPMLTLLVVMALVGHITRRLLDAERAGYALLMVPLSAPLVFQLQPMRIDHHGWQVVCALAALAALIRPRADLKSGLLAGLAIALLLTISLEGLPIAATLIGLAGLGWVLDPTRRDQFAGAAVGTFAGAFALQLATRGPHFMLPACDAMAPVWLAALGCAAAGATLAVQFGAAPRWARLGLVAVTGASAAAALVAIAPDCVAGPFGKLDPIIRELWYEKVSEGLPVWQQVPVWAMMMVGVPLVSILGSIHALRTMPAARRPAWLLATGAMLAAFALSLLVARAAATANAFAIPGAAYVVVALLHRARRVPRLLPRLAATCGALLTAAPGLAAIPLLGLPQQEKTAATIARDADTRFPRCRTSKDPLALAALPPALLFAPIDIAPEIIAGTDHRAITSGHHRNSHAMRDVMTAFTGTPDEAHLIVTRYQAQYVVGCPASIETELYQNVAPDGFWARLERGERVAWLRPVATGTPALAWRIIRPLPSPTPHP